MISLAICDDDDKILAFLKEKLEKHYEDRLHINQYKDAEQLVSEWERIGEMKENIVIMDIRYARSNGIDAALELQQSYGHAVKVIFLTGYSDYSTDIFRAEPTYFLRKPIDEEKLYEAVDRAIQKVEEERDGTISIRTKGKLTNLDMNKIMFLESDRRNLIIHERSKTIVITAKLDDIEPQLNGNFLRCHQSFLVNMNYIKNFIDMKIEMVDSTIIPVSRSCSKSAREEFLNYLGRSV